MPHLPDEMTAAEYRAMVDGQAENGTRRKYRNQPTVIDGIRFDSHAEARRYQDLVFLRDAGEITDLELQPAFPLVVNGMKVGAYVADFAYIDASGDRTVEDVKSSVTRKNRLYRLKKKLVSAIYGIDIVEVER